MRRHSMKWASTDTTNSRITAGTRVLLPAAASGNGVVSAIIKGLRTGQDEVGGAVDGEVGAH